jgi:ubiquinone/menaquinone biosynthesis C-methylase UbiE
MNSEQAEMVIGIDPSPRLLALPRQRAIDAGIKAQLLVGSASASELDHRFRIQHATIQIERGDRECRLAPPHIV